jgi:hypothetical protein
MAIRKRVVILGDDDALIQNSFVGLMEFCLINSWRLKLST